jgi:hypothetical protein
MEIEISKVNLLTGVNDTELLPFLQLRTLWNFTEVTQQRATLRNQEGFLSLRIRSKVPACPEYNLHIKVLQLASVIRMKLMKSV